MKERVLARLIAKAITKGSKYYHARVSSQPRLYMKMAGDRKSVFLRHGIVIEKNYDIYWIYPKAFVFMPEIERYIRKQTRKDKNFSTRLQNQALSPDDIERMIFFSSRGRIKLRMKGRKIYEYKKW